MLAGIYIQGSRPSHPFKVIEPQTLAPNQNVDVAALQIRGVSSSIPSDRRSITESLGSERTSSSVSMHRAPAILSGSFRLDKSDSRSSIERNADGLSSSQNLRIENFISQQVFLQIFLYYTMSMVPNFPINMMKLINREKLHISTLCYSLLRQIPNMSQILSRVMLLLYLTPLELLYLQIRKQSNQ